MVLRKPCLVSQATRVGRSGSRRPSVSTGTGSGVSSRSRTNSREMRALSACSISMSRRLDGFIAGRSGEHGFQVAELVDQLRRALRADAGNAGDIVGGIADQRLNLDHLVGGDAELLHHLGWADRLLLDRIQHVDAGTDQLHQVLVGGHDGHLTAGIGGRQGVGGDQVVGLPVRQLDRRERRTPRWLRGPGRIVGSAPRAVAGGAPCRRHRGGFGTSAGRRRR